MSKFAYDITSPESLRDFARKLKGTNLGALRQLPSAAYKPGNKGSLGSMVEEYFYEYKPGANRLHEPDFVQAGVELKVTGVLPNTRVGEAPYRAKERLVLTMISYMNLADEVWETSSLLKKCRLMLILFYLYERGVAISDLKFVMDPVLWNFPQADLEVIERDWQIIKQKILDGKAHELSEGDTFYLGACRKGSGGKKERLREQPYSTILAKSRAFSLKPSYVNSIINTHWRKTEIQGLLHDEAEAERGIEAVALEKFEGLKGKRVNELLSEYGLLHEIVKAKSVFSMLANRILGSKKMRVPEFEKAGIVMKTIRLQQNGTPKEAMSFPAFKFLDIAGQTWLKSELYETLEKKFFFVIYQFDENGELRFEKAMFWNMPYEDREVARQEWNRTRTAIQASDMRSFPKASEDRVIHVRPHGRNAADVLPLPDGTMATKRCFWLNQQYLKKQIRTT